LRRVFQDIVEHGVKTETHAVEKDLPHSFPLIAM